MEYLNGLGIDSLKGVRNIAFQNFASINLITGPNACGKTTVLDAIELITNPADPMQFIKLASQSSAPISSLFHRGETQLYCKMSATLLGKPCFTELISHNCEYKNSIRGEHRFGIYKNGVFTTHFDEVKLSMNDVSSKPTPHSFINIRRIFNDLSNVSLTNIIRDSVMKEKVLSILSLFDSRITNIGSSDFKNTYISHITYGNVDVSFFSAGIQKILNFADKMAGFQNGVLLIDDFEEHFSPQTMYEVVSFLYTLAKERQIQLFITTHSQESIDEWLDISNFYNELSRLKIIRMKSNEIQSSFTEFTGKEAYELRLEKELDFRYEYPTERRTI